VGLAGALAAIESANDKRSLSLQESIAKFDVTGRVCALTLFGGIEAQLRDLAEIA
jgi:hypothetical protein